MYKITINNQSFKTNSKTLHASDRIIWLAPKLREIMYGIWAKDYDLKTKYFIKDNEVIIDWRSREAKNLKWFSWGELIK